MVSSSCAPIRAHEEAHPGSTEKVPIFCFRKCLLVKELLVVDRPNGATRGIPPCSISRITLSRVSILYFHMGRSRTVNGA